MNKTKAATKKMKRLKHGQAGLTLVELLIAISLGIFLSWGAIQAFLTSKQTYTLQQTLARIQENARMAQELMGYDIRDSGAYGCATGRNVGYYTKKPITAADYATGIRAMVADYVKINGLTGTMNSLATQGQQNPTAERNFAYATFVINNVSGAANADTTLLAALNPAPLAGTDVVIVQNAENMGAYVQPAPASSNLLLNVPARGFSINDHLAVTDPNCRQLYIFKPSSLGGGGTQIGVPAPGLPVPVWGGKNLWDAGASIMRLRSTIYYIANNGAGIPSLYRRVSGSAAPALSDELLNGVENLQVEVGIDTNNDGVVDSYTTPNAVTPEQWNAWNDSNMDGDIQEGPRLSPDVSPQVEQNVVAIRYSLLLRSDTQLLEAPQQYTYNGVTTTPTDRRLRQVMTSTVGIRSRLN